MIISKTVTIRVHYTNIDRFKTLGYNNINLGKIITILVEHLSKGSHVKIKVKCDICGEENEVVYQNYIRQIKKYDFYCCHDKCSWIKNKQTNLERHGVEFPQQSEDIRNTTIKNNLKKYGVPYYSNPEKTKKTNLEEYGVENVFQLEKIQEKSKQTCVKKYGVENVFQSEEIKELSNKTKKEKYGDENYHNVEKQIETITGLSYDEYLEKLPDFKKYRIQVYRFTRKQPLHKLKNIEKRKRDQYWLDHKFSIKEGFINNICPYIIGNIINLEMLPWKDNISKHDKCSLTEEELFKKFENKNELF